MVVNRVCVIIAISIYTNNSWRPKNKCDVRRDRYLLNLDNDASPWIIHNTVLAISVVHKLFTEYLSAASSYG